MNPGRFTAASIAIAVAQTGLLFGIASLAFAMGVAEDPLAQSVKSVSSILLAVAGVSVASASFFLAAAALWVVPMRARPIVGFIFAILCWNFDVSSYMLFFVHKLDVYPEALWVEVYPIASRTYQELEIIPALFILVGSIIVAFGDATEGFRAKIQTGAIILLVASWIVLFWALHESRIAAIACALSAVAMIGWGAMCHYWDRPTRATKYRP